MLMFIIVSAVLVGIIIRSKFLLDDSWDPILNLYIKFQPKLHRMHVLLNARMSWVPQGTYVYGRACVFAVTIHSC